MPVLEFRGTLHHCTTVGELDATLHGLFENDLARLLENSLGLAISIYYKAYSLRFIQTMLFLSLSRLRYTCMIVGMFLCLDLKNIYSVRTRFILKRNRNSNVIKAPGNGCFSTKENNQDVTTSIQANPRYL